MAFMKLIGLRSDTMTKPRPLIIAVDGPSGAGKSTLGRRLARELGLLYIDTGAMYRAVALAVVGAGVSVSDIEAVAEAARRASIRLEGDPDSLRVLLDDRDVSEEIRGEEVGRLASVVSAIPAVRRELVSRQREMGEGESGVLLDGRDIGTVVFPSADVKFFLTAVPEARARRRLDEERARVAGQTFDETLADINERDRRDATRDDSPLKIADDAVVIDTTELPIEEVFQRMLEVVRERQSQ
ncbi:MAG: CMP/dCMP kinase [Acidobacteriota bacterium]|jgi:cytidylate kinase|nr:CMP/dCMP kinase [Acidobacteriota bacterium]